MSVRLHDDKNLDEPDAQEPLTPRKPIRDRIGDGVGFLFAMLIVALLCLALCWANLCVFRGCVDLVCGR